jgi:gamma-glutamyltranspeptidase/glutathione hydrolase
MAPGALEPALERTGRQHRGRHRPRSHPARPLRPAGGGTAYLATADRWGGVVSLIESNSYGFGSGLVDPETGIGYQNRGASFSLDPAASTFWRRTNERCTR